MPDQKGFKEQEPTKQFLQQYEHRQSLDEIFEEKVIQDKRSMNVCFNYKEYPFPEFFQAPQFVMFKDQSKIRNHKYQTDKDDGEVCYQIAPFPPKPQEYKPERHTIDHRKPQQKEIATKEKRPADKFDIKEERKKGNKFWRESEE